jgi:cytochrome c biogenesis protein CcmG/thiol:disulfide interchange protein DsbE
MPYLRDVYKNYGTGGTAFRLLGVNQADPKDDISTFGNEYQVNYPLLYDANSTVNVAYGITSLPMTYFVDKSGVVRYVAAQELTPQTLKLGMAAIGITIKA